MKIAERIARSRSLSDALGVLFRDARVPILVLQPDGTFATANDVARQQYGYSMEELLTLRIHDLVVDPRHVDEDLARVMANSQIQLARRMHRTKDGTTIWVIPAASPIMVDGQAYIASVLQDVTPVVEAEARATRDEQRAEMLWRAASERLSDGIALIDRHFRLVHVNSALRALLQLSEEAIVGRPCAEVFPTCRKEDPCPHARAGADQRRKIFEVIGRATGKPLRIEVVPCPPESPHFAFIHVAHDLSEERAFRSKLISADRLATIGRLAAGVAHEVNNPAALVTVNLGVLRDRFAAGTVRTADALAMLDESMEGMARIHEMVRDLKGLARERARERVDLGDLVTSAVNMAAHATRGQARVDKSIERGVCAHTRGARITQVVLNLLINAAQAIQLGRGAGERAAEAWIGVRTFRAADKACIEVEDSGPGIPDEIADLVFQPFFTTREKAGGTGLGLWLAREIVQEEGGTLVLCREPGRGARFLLSLPSAPREARAAERPT